MCNVTAQPGFELSSELPSSTAAVRFSMKLPRYHHHHFAPSQAPPQGHVHVHARAAPSAANHDCDPAVLAPGSSNLRRVHSANVAASSRKATDGSGSTHGHSHHSRHQHQHRSRSHESLPRQQQQHFQPVQITQILPIPCNGRYSSSSTSPSAASSVDKSDLTRMYDYATWNMYDRIVSARRTRLANAMAAAKNGAVAAATASRELCHGKEQGKGKTKTAATAPDAAATSAATFSVDSTAAACADAADAAIAKNAKATSATPDDSSATAITFESDYYDYSTASSSASAASSFGMGEAAQLQATTNPERDHEDHFIFHMEM